MFSLNRRRFLGTGLGLATGVAAGPLFLTPPAVGQQSAQPVQPRSGPKSLFLTWWTDPTTTMVIQWIADAPAAAIEIKYFPVTPTSWQTAPVALKDFPATTKKVHRCELARLTPGTEYKFTIGADPAEYKFRTMPAKATNSFQFVTGGDAGVGAETNKTSQVAARQEPYFALIGGDVAYDNGSSPDTFVTFMESYSQHMIDPQGRLIPMITCIGNHEVQGGFNGRREGAAQYLSVFDGLFKDDTYGVLDFGDYLSFVLLDTGHIAKIEGAQTDWLAKTLADREGRPNLYVANHVPAYPSYRSLSTGDGNRQHWSPLFEKFNVDLVLEHHDHTFKRTHRMKGGMIDSNGILYLGDGSWGKLRTPVPPEERPYLAAVSKAYHMTIHRLEGDHRFHVALDNTGRLVDVCSTEGKRPARRR